MTLTPGIGRVFARGTVRVTPSATTTYTLRTEGGPDKQVVTRSVTVVVRGTQPVKVEENASRRCRRPVYRMANRTCKGSGSAVTSRVGSRLVVASVRSPYSPPPTDRPTAPHQNLVSTTCGVRRHETAGRRLLRGIGPGVFRTCLPLPIVQNPQTIVMLVERMHLHRIIQIGAEHSADVLNGERLSYLGFSVAHWEGDTLVVDTRGFNDKVYVGTNNGSFTGGFKHSPKLHMVERFTRINYGTLEVDVMLEDPIS